MKKYRWWLMATVIMGLVVWLAARDWSENDTIFGVVSDKGVRLVSISWGRRMVNELLVKPEVELWVPYGPGWYRSDSITRLLLQEKKAEKIRHLFFYNFGIMPRVVIWNNLDDWENNLAVVNSMGLVNWLRFKLGWERLMWKEEVVEGQIDDDKWDTKVPRDLADSMILKSPVRISVLNASGENGLGNWISVRLNRGGFAVISVDNTEELIDGCRIAYPDKLKNDYVVKQLNEIFPECERKNLSESGGSELELYFGDKQARMINYQSYNNLTN